MQHGEHGDNSATDLIGLKEVLQGAERFLTTLGVSGLVLVARGVVHWNAAVGSRLGVESRPVDEEKVLYIYIYISAAPMVRAATDLCSHSEELQSTLQTLP